MDKPSKYILSTIVLAALINLTFEKSYSDINSTALGLNDMKERDENIKNMPGSVLPLVETPANLTPLAITKNSENLMTNDSSASKPGNSTPSTRICRNIDVRNKVGFILY